jgi:hypothetical protein
MLCSEVKASTLLLFLTSPYCNSLVRLLMFTTLLTEHLLRINDQKMKFIILLVAMVALFASVSLAGPSSKNAKSKYSKNKKGKPHQGV